MENGARKYWFTALLFALSALICLWLGIFFIVQPPKESVMFSDNSAITGATTTSAERTVDAWRNSNDRAGTASYLFGENGAPGLGSDPGNADPAGHAIWESIAGAELYCEHYLYTVTINVNPSGYGTVSPSTVANVPYGTVLSGTTTATLIFGNGLGSVTASATTATAQYNYSFSSWTSSNGWTITKDTTITANFSRATRNYTVTFTAGTGGSVNRSTLSVPYGTSISVSGATVTINGTTTTATANTGYTFSSWSNTSGTVTAARTITATFTANTYTISYTMNSGTHNGSWATSYTFSTSSQTKSIGTASRTGCVVKAVSTSKGSISGSTLTIPASATGNITVTWTWTQTAAILSLGTLGSGPLSGYKYFTSNGYNWVIIGYYGVTNYSLPNAVSNSEIGSGNVLCLSEKVLYESPWGSDWRCACAINPPLSTYVGSDIRPYVQYPQLKTNNAGGWTATSGSPANNGLFLLAASKNGCGVDCNFKVDTYLTTMAKRKAYDIDGKSHSYWSRSGCASRADLAILIQFSDHDGDDGFYPYDLTRYCGVRPAFVLKVQ